MTNDPNVDTQLDRLLRQWHEVNADRARAGRDELLATLARESSTTPVAARLSVAPPPSVHEHAPARPDVWLALRAAFASPSVRAAASFIVFVALLALILPRSGERAAAECVMLSEGGRLVAHDQEGRVIGPCVLQHTDVDVDVMGRFTRVTITQDYANPYDHKVEAVYTFPLSHRAAVDRMTMTVGDRVVVGSVKERAEARRVYESARASGYVASLLEQERPNIFTQSVSNIEPEADVQVQISYVETVEEIDGVYRFVFPMVVSPRYIPGTPLRTTARVPAELESRSGVILLGPAQLVVGPAAVDAAAAPVADDTLGTLHPTRLQSVLEQAHPIAYPGALWWGSGEDVATPPVWHAFEATYADGAKETGFVFTDGTGVLNQRWFYCDLATVRATGTGFEADTDQVPDASRITPQPVRPDECAGHDISVHVDLDTGGSAIRWLDSELHDVKVVKGAERPRSLTVDLRDKREIPNRDFILKWSVEDDAIRESQFAHYSAPDAYGDWSGGFATLMVDPPARVAEADIRVRELIFVLDSSGSMKEFPIEKAKELLALALRSMRPDDRFNIVTFNETAEKLFSRAIENTEDNRTRAMQYVDERHGGGGTEMKKGVLMALERSHRSFDFEGETDDDARRTRYVLFVSDGEIGNDDEVIAAVRDAADATRVFTIGIGNSPNRSLMDGMARAGRGASDYLSLEGDAKATLERFIARIERPVLTNIEIELSEGLELIETSPPIDAIPDLMDESPLVIHGRYAQPGRGTMTIRGQTAHGAYERTIAVTLPGPDDADPGSDVVPTLWARGQVDEALAVEDAARVVAMGTTFSIMTKHTSFVAVEKSRVTIDGRSMLVAVPIEHPDGQSWAGTFGPDEQRRIQEGRQLARQADALLKDDGVTLYGLAPMTKQSYGVDREPAGHDATNALAQYGKDFYRYQRMTETAADQDQLMYHEATEMNLIRDQLTSDAAPARGRELSLGQTPALTLNQLEERWKSRSSHAGDAATALPGLASSNDFVGYVAAPAQNAPVTDLSLMSTDAYASGTSFHVLQQMDGRGRDVIGGGGGGGGGGSPSVQLGVPSTDPVVSAGVPLRGQAVVLEDLAQSIDAGLAGAPVVTLDEMHLKKVRRATTVQESDERVRDVERRREEEVALWFERLDALQKHSRYDTGLEAADQLAFFDDQNGTVRGLRLLDETSQLPFPGARVTLATIDRIEAGETEAARTLREYLPAEAAALRRVLDDPDATDEEQRVVAQAVGAAVRARLERVIAQQIEVERLRRILHPSLWAMSFGETATDKTPVTDGLRIRDGRIMVTVLLDVVTAHRLRALRDAGFVVIDTANAIPIAVGTVSPDALQDLARVEGVRRIEPTRD